MRILIAGASGQLGTALQRARLPAGWVLLTPTRAELDLLRPETLRQAVGRIGPDAVINAAAYTAVDKAEREPEQAFAINCTGAAGLAEAAAALDAPLVHLSTDYVFPGDKAEPYVETDPTGPLGIYGRSKAEGEEAVRSAHARAVVLRTAWVYSAHRTNFVRTMLRISETQAEVSVVADQVGRPTAAPDLAAACIAVAQKQLAGEDAARGIYHYCGAGEASWADLAEAVFTEASAHGRATPRVKRITTEEFPTAAKRPANSRLDTTKIEVALGIHPRPWRQALKECVTELLQR